MVTLPLVIACLLRGATIQETAVPETIAVQRLDTITQKLKGASDPVPLLTEAVRLCGFAVWTEDRQPVSQPLGDAHLGLALTTLEIKDFAQMYQRGDTVKFGDLTGAYDYLLRGTTKKLATKNILRPLLTQGTLSANATTRSLTFFLRSLASKHANGGDVFYRDDSDLDPIQALILTRLTMEEMRVPLHQLRANLLKKVLLAGQSPSEPAEAPGWAEDAFVGGVTGLQDALSDLEIDGAPSAVSAAQGVVKEVKGVTNRINAGATFTKFLLTYTYLQGRMEIAAPGNPLVRTKDREPGDVRTVTAKFYIDGAKATDDLKDFRKQLAFIGMDTDMPKTGPLKGVETYWDLDQSRRYESKQMVQAVSGTGDLSKIRTDSNGVATVKFEGKAHNPPLDPKRVRPWMRQVTISVTPQFKSVEMMQDLVDATTGAIAVRGAAGKGVAIAEGGGEGAGIGIDDFAAVLTPVMEMLYRSKWKGSVSKVLRVKDWQQATEFASVTLDAKGVASVTSRDLVATYSIDRHLEGQDLVMSGMFLDGLPKVDLSHVPESMRAQMEKSMKQMQEMASKPKFVFVGPGEINGSIQDLTSIDSIEHICGDSHSQSMLTVSGTKNSQVGDEAETHSGVNLFSIELDPARKVAKVLLQSSLNAHKETDHIEDGKSPQHTEIDTPMDILEGISLSGGKSSYEGIEVPYKAEEDAATGTVTYTGEVSLPFDVGPKKKDKGTLIVKFKASHKKKNP